MVGNKVMKGSERAFINGRKKNNECLLTAFTDSEAEAKSLN